MQSAIQNHLEFKKLRALGVDKMAQLGRVVRHDARHSQLENSFKVALRVQNPGVRLQENMARGCNDNIKKRCQFLPEFLFCRDGGLEPV